MAKKPLIAILSAGGDCPGINNVIFSAFLAAKKAGVRIIGVKNGYAGLSGDKADLIRLNEVALRNAARSTRCSIIGMSRKSLYKHPDEAKHAARLLKENGVTHLIAIGGDDTLRSTDELAAACKELGFTLGIIHCPKTIDNDFPFKDQNVQTFGFDAAADVVAETINRVKQGASMLLCIMGRYTGFLAVEGAMRAGLKICIVPEMFNGRRISLIDLCDITERAILANPRTPIAFAEGMWEVLDETSQRYIYSLLASEDAFNAFKDGKQGEGKLAASKDEHGHVEYGNFPWFENFACMMSIRMQKKAKVRYKLIGYETRIQAPYQYDMALTKTIGTGAVKLLLQGKSHLTVYGIPGSNTKRPSFSLQTIAFDDLPRDARDKIQIRTLDIKHPRWRAIIRKSMLLLN